MFSIYLLVYTAISSSHIVLVDLMRCTKKIVVHCWLSVLKSICDRHADLTISTFKLNSISIEDAINSVFVAVAACSLFSDYLGDYKHGT